MDEPLLRAKVERWIDDDPDPATRRELAGLVESGAWRDLAERFSGELEFGTAGLRGVLGGGPMRMNRAVVRRATAGLAAHLAKSVKDAKRRGVVVGCDARLMSRELAEEAAQTLAGQGFAVHLFDEPVPTPLAAFAVLDRRAAAGAMITASHNPPEYNGYKVYWENGAQIIPPHDQAIAACIRSVARLQELPMPPLAMARARRQLRGLGKGVVERYLTAVLALRVHPGLAGDFPIVYTPLHGVGGRLARTLLARAGFSQVHVVEEQAEPDGRFPTVRFPNPEEKGAMDLALALARERDAELVLANDPDADRLAVAVKRGPGDWLQLTGDQVGAMLAYYLLTERGGGPERLAVTTVVSSALLGRMASVLGVRYAETLTGFKWIANRAIAAEGAEGSSFVMGYEEALGYSVGTVVRDKDGISAALLFAELAAFCRARGQVVLDYLEEVYRRFGFFRSLQRSLTLPGADGAARIRAMMDALRASDARAIAGTAIVARRDLRRGLRTSASGEERIDLPQSDVLVFELEGGGRIVCRPSGTEPKIKFYFELCETMAPTEGLEEATARADGRMQGLVDGLLALARADR